MKCLCGTCIRSFILLITNIVIPYSLEKDGEWKKGNLELENQIEFTYDDIEFVIIPSNCDMNTIIDELTVSLKVILKKIKIKSQHLMSLFKNTTYLR
jgi:hypothetical protein